MAQFKTDLQDINFNLFNVLQVQNNREEFEDNDLKEIIDQFNKFTENEIFPTREVGDKEGVKLENRQVVTPENFKKLQEQFYENGWFGLGYPEEIGGINVPEAVTAACVSIANGANISWAMFYGLTRALLNVILKVGTEEQKSLYAPKFMSGEWGGTMCLTEAGAGSDVGALTTMATPLGNGRYKIKGVKQFITAGDSDLYQNIIHLVLARTPDAPKGVKGLSLFAVPKYKIKPDGSNGDSNDVFATKIEEKMGIHGSPTCELTFGAEGNCEGELVGKELEGMANMFIMMNEERLYVGVQGESQANLAVQLTEPYINERVQFGTEIINHPDVKRIFLRMRALSRGMRALNLYTANLFDLSHKGDKSVEAEIGLLTPICKAYCTDGGFNVTVDAVQAHGGYGYCVEYGIEQFVRDAKICSIYEGTNGIQAIDLVTRKILKDQGKAFMALGEKIQKTMQTKEAQEWGDELSMVAYSMKKAQEVLQYYGKWAMEKNFNAILESCTDFLDYAGHTIVAWLLLDHAIKAKTCFDKATGDEKTFYQGKITDYKVFCRYYLTKNKAIAYSILNFKERLTDLQI